MYFKETVAGVWEQVGRWWQLIDSARHLNCYRLKFVLNLIAGLYCEAEDFMRSAINSWDCFLPVILELVVKLLWYRYLGAASVNNSGVLCVFANFELSVAESLAFKSPGVPVDSHILRILHA